MAYRSLDKLDRKILGLIAEDARIPFLEVARSCNVSGAAIHQRIQKLTNLGILLGSQFLIDPEKIVMLNITGGGEHRCQQDKELWYLEPSLVFPLTPDPEEVVAKTEALFD